jgi:hypothetical protein
MSDQEWRDKTAWRNALVAVALNIVGMPLELVIMRTIPGIPVWPPLASIAVAVVLLVVLLARRRTPSVALGNTVFLLDVFTIAIALWVIDGSYAASGRNWVPFQEYKLSMVTIAVLAPEAWVGALSIAAYATASIVQLATFTPAVRDHLALGEPWATIAFAVFAAILLGYRLKRAALELDIALAHARLASAEHLAKVLLAVRDRANTPLQTIAFAAETAREMHPDVGLVMDRVERSLDKLRDVDRQLRGFDVALTWTEHEESLDALALTSGPIRRS